MLEISPDSFILWRKVMVGKFGKELGGWCSWVRREVFGVRLWKTIRKGCEVLKNRTSVKNQNFGKMYGVMRFL